MELFYLNRRKREGRRCGAVLSEQKAGEKELFYLNRRKRESRRCGAVLSEQKEEGRQERWSCFI